MPEETDTINNSEFKEELSIEEGNKVSRKIFKTLVAFSVLGLLIFIFLYLSDFVQTAPKNFPLDTPITIESGTSLRAAISQLKAEGLIRSEIALYAVMQIAHKDNSIKASTYVFDKPLDLQTLALELTKGQLRSDLIKITLIEGETVKQVAKRANDLLSNFDSEIFLELADSYEGQLFPETYLVPSDFTAKEFFELLTTTFAEKIAPYNEEITNHKLTLDEIIILASILEREANSSESMSLVSGILQKRLEIDMPLQVDASLEYVIQKPLSELTAEDLDTDSPYNTYLNYGLPPTAIGNPGEEAILAVLKPKASEYLFYITGDDGNFYYAKNFEAHKANVAKYLR